MIRLTERRISDSPIKLMMENLPMMLCELLRNAFTNVPDIHVIEATNGAQEVLGGVKSSSIDVILLGSSREDNVLSASTIVESLLERYGNAKVIVLTQKPDYGETISLFRSGASGVFCSEYVKFDLLCKSVRCVYQGQVWANNELIAYLVASLRRPKSREVTDSRGRRLLTAREQQVLHLLADGLSNHDLATVLKLSEHTVKNHLFRIYDKLGVSNRMEAVLYAITPRHTQPLPIAAREESSHSIRIMKAG